MRLEITESQIKQQVKMYLTLRGIFNAHLTQGLGCYPGLPDRFLHVKGRVVYLEIKRLGNKLSDHQRAFQAQCLADSVPYWVIHSVEELEEELANVDFLR